MAAVAAGIRHVQATINGYGERCGNANMVSILANLALKTPHELVPGRRRRPRRPDRARRARSPRSPTSPRTTTSRTSAGRRSPTRAASTARPWPRSSGATSTSIRPRSATPAGSSSPSSAAGPTPSIRAEQLGHELEGVVDPRELSTAHQAARGRGPRVRGRRGVASSCSSAATQPDYAAPFRIVDYTCLVEQRDGRELLAEATVKVEVDGEVLHTAADGNGPVNALDAALRKALGAFYPGIDERPPRRLQGAHPRRRRGDGRPDAGHHRLADGARDLVDDGQRHEHHRGLGGGPRRLARVRDLEVRRRAAAPRRAALHDGSASQRADPTAASTPDARPRGGARR